MKEDRYLVNDDKRRPLKYIGMTIAILLSLVIISACIERDGSSSSEGNESIKEKIKTKLIGMEITYKDKKGENQTYIIKDSDVKAINETQFEGKKAWKVRIGEAMAWDYYFDDKGEKIVKTEQLFRT